MRLTDDQLQEIRNRHNRLQYSDKNLAVLLAYSEDVPKLLEHIEAQDERLKQLSELTTQDIVCKITERIEKLEAVDSSDSRLRELSALQGWILCGDEY